MKVTTKGKQKKNSNSNEDLVCVFLGLELYTTKQAAALLKTDIMDLLRTDVKEIPVLAVKTHEPVELTPTFSISWDKIKSVLTKKSKNS